MNLLTFYLSLLLALLLPRSALACQKPTLMYLRTFPKLPCKDAHDTYSDQVNTIDSMLELSQPVTNVQSNHCVSGPDDFLAFAYKFYERKYRQAVPGEQHWWCPPHEEGFPLSKKCKEKDPGRGKKVCKWKGCVLRLFEEEDCRGEVIRETKGMAIFKEQTTCWNMLKPAKSLRFICEKKRPKEWGNEEDDDD